MYEAIEAGVPLGNLDKLAAFMAPGDDRWKYRIVPPTTYVRCKKGSRRFSREVSQKIARVATVARAACDVFGDDDTARDFLNRPNPLLRGKAPIDLAITNFAGARAVTGVLFAGSYGSGA